MTGSTITPRVLPAWWASALFERGCRAFLCHGGGLTVIRDAPLPAGPYLICSNHLSHVDSLALMLAAELPFLKCGLLAASDYFFDNTLRLFLVSALLRLAPVDRRPSATGFQRVMDTCRQLLADRISALIIYPQGGRQQPGAPPVPFKRLAARLAIAFQLPMVPAHLAGTEQVLPRRSWRPRRAAITVRLGVPLIPGNPASPRDIRAETWRLTALLEQQVAAMAAAEPS